MSDVTEDVAVITKSGADAFPADAVEACLVAELVEAVRTEAEIREIDVPLTTIELRVMQISIDSLVVVELLVAVEPILGFELKNRIVKQGGYASVDEAKNHLMPRIQKEWIKKKGRKS